LTVQRVAASRLPPIVLLAVLAACGTKLEQPRSYLVYFDTNSAALTQDGQRIVGAIADAVRDVSPSKIAIAGRADGNTAHDAALAAERAATVREALAQKGVPASKLEKEADAAPSGRIGLAAHQVVVTLLP
jgi:outer membrane protein OmpA-like peptidoglycan-associated protein